MQTHLVDKFPLECIGVRVEIPELDETELAKLGYTAVSCLRLEWWEGWNGEGDFDDRDNSKCDDMFVDDDEDEPEGRVGRAPSPRF